MKKKIILLVCTAFLAVCMLFPAVADTVKDGLRVIAGVAVELIYGPTNYSTTAPDLESHLEGIDNQLGTVSTGKYDSANVKIDTTTKSILQWDTNAPAGITNAPETVINATNGVIVTDGDTNATVVVGTNSMFIFNSAGTPVASNDAGTATNLTATNLVGSVHTNQLTNAMSNMSWDNIIAGDLSGNVGTNQLTNAMAIMIWTNTPTDHVGTFDGQEGVWYIDHANQTNVFTVTSFHIPDPTNSIISVLSPNSDGNGDRTVIRIRGVTENGGGLTGLFHVAVADWDAASKITADVVQGTNSLNGTGISDTTLDGITTVSNDQVYIVWFTELSEFANTNSLTIHITDRK